MIAPTHGYRYAHIGVTYPEPRRTRKKAKIPTAIRVKLLMASPIYSRHHQAGKAGVS